MGWFLPTSDDLHLAVHSFMSFLLLFQLQETKIMFSLMILKVNHLNLKLWNDSD